MDVLAATPAEAGSLDEDLAPSLVEDEHMCGECGKVFPTAGGCKVHRANTHGTSLMARFCEAVIDSCSPRCGIKFRCRLRVLHHLVQGKSAGRAAFDEGFFAVQGAAAVAAADETDRLHRRPCRLLGVHELAGPQCMCAAR